MNSEFIFDISLDIKNQTLSVWKDMTQNPAFYLGRRLDEYNRAPSIRPLWNKIIRGGYENGDLKEFTLLGSFNTLDAVVFEHKRQEKWFEITPEDISRYDRFCDDFLVDRRWRGLTEKKGGLELVKAEFAADYLALLTSSQNKGPSVDISPLLQVLEKDGEHRLASVVKEGSEILVENIREVFRTSEDEVKVREAFRKGGWIVLAPVVVKYGGETLNRLLLEQKSQNRSN